jgi:hypothetical protein
MPKRRSTTMRLCCGVPSVMIQYDSGHWAGMCDGDCGKEGLMHWNKKAARDAWNHGEYDVPPHQGRVGRSRPLDAPTRGAGG